MGESDRARPRVPSLTAGRDTDGGVYPDRGDLDTPQERSVPAQAEEAQVVPWSPAQPDDDTLARWYRWPEPSDGDAGADRAVVRANMVASLDGGTTVHGRSGGLGNAADEHLFALLRDLANVVLVGAGTVRAERYGGIRLTEERAARRLRWGLSASPPPIAVVTSRGLDPQSPLFTDTVTPPIVITTPAGAGQVPPGVQVISSNSDQVDLAAALRTLRQNGFRHVHCEGGPALLATLVAEGLLDELCLTISPMLLGTGSAPMVPTRLGESVRWSLDGVHVVGDHLFTRYRWLAVPGTPDRTGALR